VGVALGPTEPLPEQKQAVAPEARLQGLTALKLWYDDWSATAHALVRKRAHLIRLGLATRRSPTTAEPDETPAPTPTQSPVPS